ncbi:MAG TPA: nucleotidyltransferase domain-containing protein [Lamprocystis sp. (in: g-proteobacteria)]|nr:nucleotidyltransferase domain-containing protein [Lamprocystis sp. (in: g-proteobacteria)]
MFHQAQPQTSAPVVRLTPGEQQLLADFADRALATLGAAGIERILVFGSRARGAGHADSDLDVAVFAPKTLGADAHRQLADLAEEAQAGWEGLPHLRPILVRTGDPTNPALLRAIAREGIEVWAKKNG